MSTDDLVTIISVIGLQLLGLWVYDTFRAVHLQAHERRLRQTRGYA